MTELGLGPLADEPAVTAAERTMRESASAMAVAAGALI